MSTNIRVQRICKHCSNEFTAKTTVTNYCSHRCASAAHKAKQKAAKVDRSNQETLRKKNQPIEDLKAKEFLAVREVAQLLNCSVRSVYYYIESGAIKAVNLGQRITRVKRSEIDKLFEQPNPAPPTAERTQFDISECYHLAEVQGKYGISESALHNIIERNSIPKIKKGWFAYVPKTAIDKLLS